MTAVRFTRTDAETYRSTDGRFTIRAEARTRTTMKHGTTRKVTGWTLRDAQTGAVRTGLPFAAAKVEADGIASAPRD